MKGEVSIASGILLSLGSPGMAVSGSICNALAPQLPPRAVVFDAAALSALAQLPCAREIDRATSLGSHWLADWQMVIVL